MSGELSRWLDVNAVPANVAAMVRTLESSATVDAGGLSDATLSIMDRILNATDEAAIFAAANAGTISGQDYVNRPFQLLAHEWKASADALKATGALPVYALMRVADMQTGEEAVVNCGGLSLVATLYSLERNGVLAAYADRGGMGLQLVSKPAGNGNVLLLQPFKLPTRGDKA